MTHTYSITGMTCSGCEATVKDLLLRVPGIMSVHADVSENDVTIEMEHHIPTTTLRQALKDHPKYQLTARGDSTSTMMDNKVPGRGWLHTYKPIVLIFGYLTAVTLLMEVQRGFSWMHWMSNFMAGFFLTFSFFKLLDVKGFAESYSSYDIVAKRWFGYGYIYPFIELALGLAYMLSFDGLITNATTFVIMSVSIVGVLQSVFSKRKIKCACLGTVFNLPMSTVTIIEDALMIAMSLIAVSALISIA